MDTQPHYQPPFNGEVNVSKKATALDRFLANEISEQFKENLWVQRGYLKVPLLQQMGPTPHDPSTRQVVFGGGSATVGIWVKTGQEYLTVKHKDNVYTLTDSAMKALCSKWYKKAYLICSRCGRGWWNAYRGEFSGKAGANRPHSDTCALRHIVANPNSVFTSDLTVNGTKGYDHRHERLVLDMVSKLEKV